MISYNHSAVQKGITDKSVTKCEEIIVKSLMAIESTKKKKKREKEKTQKIQWLGVILYTRKYINMS